MTSSYLLSSDPAATNRTREALADPLNPGVDLGDLDLKPLLTLTQVMESQPLHQIMKRHCPVTFGAKTKDVEDGQGRTWIVRKGRAN